MFLGADTEAARGVVQAMTTTAGELEERAMSLRSAASSMPWEGSDAEAFGEAANRLVRLMDGVEEGIRAAAHDLEEQAARQDEASADDGGGAAASSAGSWSRTAGAEGHGGLGPVMAGPAAEGPATTGSAPAAEDMMSLGLTREGLGDGMPGPVRDALR